MGTNRKLCYCHFSFRRPRGKPYGIFAAAIYTDFEGKNLVAEKTKALELWENQQNVTAIQAYSNALETIWEWQPELLKHGVTNILLVTDNSILAGWIVDPYKNRGYTDDMMRAVEPYKVGAPKEIVIQLGLCEPRKSEKSHKYCREELICNTRPTPKSNVSHSHRLDLGDVELKTALDIASESKPDGLADLKEI